MYLILVQKIGICFKKTNLGICAELPFFWIFTEEQHGSITLYTYSEIRRSECVNLRLDQIDLIAKEIYVNDKTVHAIREYLKVRRSESPYLFVSRQSEKLSPSRINQIFNQYSDVITPKMLRHYFCSNALDTVFLSAWKP